MYKLTIKTRGKLIQLPPSGKTIRTPRIVYISEEDVTLVKSILRNVCIADYTLEQIDPNEIPPPRIEVPTKMSRIKNDSCEIQIGGKIGGRR